MAKKNKGPTPRAVTPRTIEGIPGTVESGYREKPIVQVPVSHAVEEKFIQMTGKTIEELGLKRFAMGACNIMTGREPAGKGGEFLWHLTISTPSRHPTWDEIKTARYRLLPLELTFGMLLPPPHLWVNVPQQDHVFQLWEIRDAREPWTSG